MNIFNIILNGLCLGGVYALIALGYTMVYGIAKMLNFAHGDIIMVGAYSILTTMSLIPGLQIPAIIAAIILCTLLGIITERLAYRPLRGASPLAVLITAIGVSYLLQSIAQIIFGSASKSITIGAWGTVSFGETTISVSSIVTLALCIIIMISLNMFVRKTRLGCAIQAVSEDRSAAQLMGINANGVIVLTFAIGSALAAVASAFYLMLIPSITPTLGSMPGIKAFTAAVIGGIGSLPGAMIGGLLLGIIEKVCAAVPVLSPYTTAIEFGLLIVILLVKPTGLLGKKKREKV